MDHGDNWKLEEYFAKTTLRPISAIREASLTMNQRDYLDILHPSPSNTAIALEYTKFFMCLFGTLVDLLIIYIIIIMRCKKVSKPVNIYIMNWLICNAAFIIVDPSEYQVYEYLANYKSDAEVICFIVSCIVTVATFDVIFMLILMLYWVCDVTKSALFDRHCHKIVTVIWVFGVVEFLINLAPCLANNMFAYMGELYLAFLAAVFIICFTVIHCWRRCAKTVEATSSLPVELVTSFVLCWATMIANAVAYHFTNNSISLMLMHGGKIIVYLYPLIVFYLCYKSDAKFAMHTRILFRIQRCESEDVTNTTVETEIIVQNIYSNTDVQVE